MHHPLQSAGVASAGSARGGLVDFHSHLLPAVDDGAADLEEARAALRLLWAQGVRTVVCTPHLRALLTHRPTELADTLERFEAAFRELTGVAAADLPEMRLARGVELMLDTPSADLSEPALRLGGTRSVLVEFPGLIVPPHSVEALRELRREGWHPIVAHPERYGNLDDIRLVDRWRQVGGSVQVNTGGVVGRYGERARRIALELLASGRAAYLASDFHARGRPTIAACREALTRSGGERQFRLLMEENPARLLAGEEPLPVPPLAGPPPLWRRLLGLRR